MLSCIELTRRVTDYVEGELSFSARVRFQLHLGMCRHCRRYVRQMRLARATLAGLPPPALLPETMEALRERFKDWKARSA